MCDGDTQPHPHYIWGVQGAINALPAGDWWQSASQIEPFQCQALQPS